MTDSDDPYRQGGYGGPPPTGSYQGVPQQPYAGGYPQAYGQPPYPGYPVPTGYPGYGYSGYPPQPQGPQRPGLVVAAAVLGYVNAGLLIVGGFLLLFGATIVNDIENAVDSGTDYATEAALLGVGNMIAAGLLIAGAVMFSGAKPVGRLLLAVGNGIVLALAVYWFLRFTDDRFNDVGSGFLVWGSLYATLAVLSLAFSFTGAINRWLVERAGT